jgi:hypothetical protein
VSDLRALCGALRETLAAADVPLVRHLVPAVDESTIRARLKKSGVAATDDLMDWWSWHNGVEQGVSQRFGPALLLSLDEALALRQENMRVAAAAADDHRPVDYWWHQAWMPIAKNDAGSIVLDTAGVGPRGTAVLMWDTWNEGFSTPRLDGLGELVRLWIRAWDADVYRYSAAAGWSYDRLRLARAGIPDMHGLV